MKKKTLTTHDIAKLLDVYPTTVVNWINEKRLEAFHTPGGHRRIKIMSLINFLKQYKIPIPDALKGVTERKKLLVVDDDKPVLNTIEKLLVKSKLDIEIYTASDGFHAGHSLSNFKPDLVILDLMLAGIDGFRICSLIKKLNRGTKVLAITGYDTDKNKRRIFGCGADDYIPKPFKNSVFLEKVKALL